MQLSRKPPLSLVRVQQSTADQLGTLVPWIARGDEASFRLFFEATNGLLFGLLLRILGHTQTAEEVLAELYEEVRRRAARFSKQNERPLTWLILIAHRRAIERLCCQLTTNRKTLRKKGGKPKSTSSINISEQRRLLRAALEAIPPLQHRMIELTFFSGMTSLEIAVARSSRGRDTICDVAAFRTVQIHGLHSGACETNVGRRLTPCIESHPLLGMCVSAQTFPPSSAISR